MKYKYHMYNSAIYILLICMIFVGCDPRYGFLESKFKLSDDSRLPKWFTLPQGYSRSDFKITIDVYTSPFLFGNNAVITLYGPSPENKVIMKKAGNERWHPLSEKTYDKYYPNYTIITIDGMDEVFEQKQPGDILYLTDDPKITSGYLK